MPALILPKATGRVEVPAGFHHVGVETVVQILVQNARDDLAVDGVGKLNGAVFLVDAEIELS